MSIACGVPLKFVGTATSRNTVPQQPPPQLHQQQPQHESSSSPLPYQPNVIPDMEDLITMDGIYRRRPPIVPILCPYTVHLEVNRRYRWCACGRSKTQPWCDDSHLPTDPQPLLFKITIPQSLHLICGCKYTSTPPWCDGSHIHVLSGTEQQEQPPTEEGGPDRNP